MIWLLRRLRPDFKTIADFRQVFRDFVKVCRSLDLFGRELVAVDGTRIKAVNSRDRNFTEGKLQRELEASQERLERYLRQTDAMDEADAGPGTAPAPDLAQRIAALRERRAPLESHRKALQESGQEQLSLTDPDARAILGQERGLQRADRGGSETQADCRAAGSQPSLRPRPAGRDSRRETGEPGRRADRCRGRQGKFQGREYCRVRGGRGHAAFAEAAAQPAAVAASARSRSASTQAARPMSVRAFSASSPDARAGSATRRSSTTLVAKRAIPLRFGHRLAARHDGLPPEQPPMLGPLGCRGTRLS